MGPPWAPGKKTALHQVWPHHSPAPASASEFAVRNTLMRPLPKAWWGQRHGGAVAGCPNAYLCGSLCLRGFYELVKTKRVHKSPGKCRVDLVVCPGTHWHSLENLAWEGQAGYVVCCCKVLNMKCASGQGWGVKPATLCIGCPEAHWAAAASSLLGR